jgi:hypothetical protein
MDAKAVLVEHENAVGGKHENAEEQGTLQPISGERERGTVKINQCKSVDGLAANLLLPSAGYSMIYIKKFSKS